MNNTVKSFITTNNKTLNCIYMNENFLAIAHYKNETLFCQLKRTTYGSLGIKAEGLAGIKPPKT